MSRAAAPVRRSVPAWAVFLMRNIKPEKDVMGFCFQTSFQLCHLEVMELGMTKNRGAAGKVLCIYP